MNECDFMKGQIQIYGELAESLEVLIKRQREDFLRGRGNPNSIEAQKINFARTEKEVKEIVEKEVRLTAAYALRLALQAREELRQMELDRQKRKEEEFYYYEELIKQKPVEARENLIDKIKQLMEFFNQLLSQLKLFLTEIAEKIAQLKAIKKAIIDYKVIPTVNRIRDDLIKQVRYSVNGVPVDLRNPLEKLFDKFIEEVHQGVTSMTNLKEKWLGGPYVEGHIASCLKETVLTDNDKRIVSEDIWSGLQSHPNFHLLHQHVDEVVKVDNLIKPLEMTKEALGKMREEISDQRKNLSDIARSPINHVKDYVEVAHLSQEKSKLGQPIKHFLAESAKEIAYINKTIQAQEEKIRQQPPSPKLSDKADEEEPAPIISHHRKL